MWAFSLFLLLSTGEFSRVEFRMLTSRADCLAVMERYGKDYRLLEPGTGRLASCTPAS